MTDRQIAYFKGHGTENDFVILPDLEGALDLTPEHVRALCDRRAGIGGDGVLRVVRSSAMGGEVPASGGATYFMDYRNADGSVAEMCGNGARVFALYLCAAGLEGSEFAFGTRGGTRHATVEAPDRITIGMGAPDYASEHAPTIHVAGHEWPGTPIHIPNPHAVVFVDDLSTAGPLLEAPSWTPREAFPDGVNVEFVVMRGDGHIAMRVHERGSGETRACGTGACAAALAAMGAAGVPARPEAPVTWRVDQPGGSVEVRLNPDGEVDLIGPAVLVAKGDISPDWWDGAGRR